MSAGDGACEARARLCLHAHQGGERRRVNFGKGISVERKRAVLALEGGVLCEAISAGNLASDFAALCLTIIVTSSVVRDLCPRLF